MPEFRKGILALAGITLFAGMASAQVGTPTNPPTVGQGPTTCTTTNGAVTPTVRAEGYTEMTGDITIACTGGPTLTLGQVIPVMNVTIFVNTSVTSRLLPTTLAPNASEALLLIDEPGAGAPGLQNQLTGYGPSVPQVLCSTANVGAGTGGCTEWVGQTTINGTTTAGVPVASNPNQKTTGTALDGVTPCTATAPCYNAASLPQGANVFQGLVTGNQVAFFGVPIMPPATSGLERIYRITNIRANANGVSAGGPTPGSIIASISVNSSSSVSITNSTLTTGFVQQGLNPSTTTLRNATNTGGGGATLPQCNSISVTSTTSTATTSVGGILFAEQFPTAFKIRNGTNANPALVQNIPGTIYNSESGFFLSSAAFTNTGTGQSFAAGQADYGTRLKATFSNVPSGVSLFVSTRDIANDFSVGSNAAQAVLVISETASSVGGVPAAAQTATYVGPGPSGATAPGIAPVTLNSGAGTAVWEIVNTNPNQLDTAFFGLYIAFTASPSNNVPAAPSSFTVTLSYAPTPSGGAFTAATGSTASSSLTIPRFSDSLNITKTGASFVLCTTALLYPYVVHTNGFDTGVALANTTSDPFGTAAQQGTCTLNFYGSSAPSAAFVTPTINSGTVYANLASTISPGFSGYIIAVCNFQYAHGFAFVSDVGARNLAMGYLPLIINNGTISARGPAGETLGN
jgi:hypothetical protein